MAGEAEHGRMMQCRGLHSTRPTMSEDKDKEPGKRLPSDDPSQVTGEYTDPCVEFDTASKSKKEHA